MLEILRLIYVLTAICVAAGLTLAGVYEVTKEPIRLTMLRELKAPAVQAVLKGYDNKPMEEMINIPLEPDEKGKPQSLPVFPAKKGGQTFAVAFETSAKGYGGPIGVMVGVDVASQKLTGVAVVSHSETPGLGSRTKDDPKFAQSFVGKELTKDLTKSDIDALSGATISTNAVVAAVNQARQLFGQHKDKMVK